MNRLNNILVVFLSCIVLVSCNGFRASEERMGYLSVSLQSDDKVYTKAAVTADRGFSLNIYRGAELKETVADHRDLASSPLELVSGTYKVVASSGNQQSAVWDTPFYRGETDVKVRPDTENSAEITCTIDNAVVSVEFDKTFTDVITDYSVKVDNGEGNLVFSPAAGTMSKTAYFSVTGTLNWSLEFKNQNGKSYKSSGSYTDVKARQHYRLRFSVEDPVEVVSGAAGIKVVVDDSYNEKHHDATLVFKTENHPTITTNEEFNIEGTITVPSGDEKPKILTATANNGMSNFIIRQKAEEGGVQEYSMWYDLVEASAYNVSEMNAAGIKASSVMYGAQEAVMDITDYVGGLTMGEYVLEAVVYDLFGQKEEKVISLNVLSGVDAEAYSVEVGATEAGITARWFTNPRPAGLGLEYRLVGSESWTQVGASDISYNESTKRFSATIDGLNALTDYEFRPYSDNDKELTSKLFRTMNTVEAVSAEPWGRFAVVTGKWNDFTGKPADIRFEYREYGTTGWLKADASTIEYMDASKTFVGEIRGLEPKVTYEFRVNSVSANEDRLTVKTFETENAGTVYNLSFDEGHWDGKIWYPFAEGAQHAWDSANGGASKGGESTTVEELTDVVSGQAVKMFSKSVVGMFAAGNLYTGQFIKAILSLNPGAELDWGVEFDSRPLALRGYYKYSPSAINKVGDGVSVSKGDPDKAQIQICLATADWDEDGGPFHINTQTKQFVDFNADYIIAYGKLESEIRYDTYHEFTIPLEYKSLTKKPDYIIISACASYLGDYFTGGEGSTLWVDEFSLEYSPENLTAAEREKVNYR